MTAPDAPARASSDANSTQSSPQKHVAGVLVTSAESRLAQAVAAGLSDRCRVRLTAPSEVQTGFDFVRSTLDDDEATRGVVRGMDAIVHVAEPPQGADGAGQIDHRTRGTYNLLKAAAQEGVRGVVYLSSLAVMTGYGERLDVNEDFRPLATSHPGVLSHYLGEFTCREFARQRQLEVVVLRLGKVVQADEVAGRPFDPLWVDQGDVVQAVSRAVALQLADGAGRLGAWSVFHIASGSPRGRFSPQKAARLLGYKPRFQW